MELWENDLNNGSINEAAKSAGSRDLFDSINLIVDATLLTVIGMLILSLRSHMKEGSIRSLFHPRAQKS